MRPPNVLSGFVQSIPKLFDHGRWHLGQAGVVFLDDFALIEVHPCDLVRNVQIFWD